MKKVAQFFRQVANRPLLVSVILVLAGIVASALPVMRAGLVLPQEYDEFAYELGAETLLQGRLANPPHPLAPFFEAMHILQKTTYASKYPPGQSLQLAAGLLLGHPVFGVWITVGLFGVAVAWMLRAVAPATWAALGGLLASWQWGALTYWGHTYWGGSLFALAGALVFGGMLRFARAPNAAAAWWAGVGAGIMALTRPYEGLWFCIIPAIVMMWSLVKAGKSGVGLGSLARWTAGAALPLAAALAFLLTYNRAVTGHALTFPHRLYQEQMMPDAPVFVWETPAPPPPDRHPEISYQINRFNPEMISTPAVTLAELLRAHFGATMWRLGQFFLPGLLGVGAAWAIISGQVWRRRAGRLALAGMAMFFLMLGTLRFFGFQHYAAAWTAPLAVLIVLGFRALCALRWRGWRLPRGLLALILAGWALATLGVETVRSNYPAPWVLDREKLIADLEDKSAADHRGDVVFVILANGQPAFTEWVYNGPNIDDQTVIFARSLGAARDVEVARYYPTRHLWKAQLNARGELEEGQLVPYDPAKTPP